MNFKKMAKRFFTLSKGHEGFTLVELIVVIAIMAILAGVAVPAYTGYIAKAEKANDLQLLGAINTAFAAAAMENAGGVQNISAASLTYGGTEGATTVTGVDSASGVADVSALSASFLKYYGTNVSSAFKVITALKYENGVFKDKNDIVNEKYPQGNGMTDAELDEARNNINEGSNFGGNTGKLTGTANGLVNAVVGAFGTGNRADMLKNNMKSEDEYNKFLEKYNLTDKSSDTEFANAAVMYTAEVLSQYGAEGVNKAQGNMATITKEIGALPAAALAYGMMAGYVNSGYNTTGDTLNEKPSGLQEVLADFDNLSKSDGFINYYKNNNTEYKGINDDVNGFMSAMDLINNYGGDFDLTKDNLFVSDETNELMNSILGSNS